MSMLCAEEMRRRARNCAERSRAQLQGKHAMIRSAEVKESGAGKLNSCSSLQLDV